MAKIGIFRRVGDNEYAGEILTLSVQASNVRIVPVSTSGENEGENPPTHRVMVDRTEIGAAWMRVGADGTSFLEVDIDDPSFSAAISARLVADPEIGALRLVWDR